MRISFVIVLILFSLVSQAQSDRDTVLKRCPVFITDTASVNNFFIEGLPCILKVYRVRGKLTIAIQQKDQFFTIFFRDKKLKTTKYTIGNKIDAKYSFRSGEQASYVNVQSGTLESSFDKEKDQWHLKLNGMIANLVERSVTYYKVRSDFYVK